MTSCCLMNASAPLKACPRSVREDHYLVEISCMRTGITRIPGPFLVINDIADSALVR
jgi:hypothetical protein